MTESNHLPSTNLIDTRSVRVVVITEYWGKSYTREDGSVVPEGWRKPRGWPAKASQRPDGDLNDFSRGAAKAYHECSLYQALTHRASSPAFFVGYRPNKIGLRLRKDCLNPLFSGFTEDAGGVHMHLALFDVDNHDETVDFDTWFDAELDKIAQFLEVHDGSIVYRSKRGYRIISLLPELFTIKDQSDSGKWDRYYTACCNYLNRKFSIKADVLLDWTRFQAVPHTKKEKDEPALELEVFGDVEKIGFWQPELEESDYPPEKLQSHYDGANFEGECQLLQLIKRSNLRCEETEYANVYDICCPNWLAHSPDSRGLQDYPSKTVLYTNGPIGKIECKSSGCQLSHPDKNTSYFKHFDSKNVEETRPKPPIDVWDPTVLNLAIRRNYLSSIASLDKYLAGEEAVDETYEVYREARLNQSRLERKDKVDKLTSRTTNDYANFAKWFVDQSLYSIPDEIAFQAYLAATHAI
jgi:hypothetical protein